MPGVDLESAASARLKSGNGTRDAKRASGLFEDRSTEDRKEVAGAMITFRKRGGA
jgi:hypothetical protein